MQDEQKYRNDLLSQIKNAYGKVVYSYTTHWKQQNIYVNRLKKLKITEIVLSSISTTGLVSFLISNQWWIALIGTIFSAISLALTLYTKDKRYEEAIASHRVSADDLWLLREKYISLMTDFESLEISEIVRKRDDLEKNASRIYKAAIPVTPAAYKEAQKALKEEEEQYFSEAELDQMLPPHLRKLENKGSEK